MSTNVFLIGFMGSGKSYWAEVWAKKYGRKLLDLDVAIEQYFGKNIATIFHEIGEEEFRRAELKILKQIPAQSSMIVACGGGAPVFFDNMNWMLENGTVIYLKANPGLLARRLMPERNERPLLKNLNDEELLKFIREKLNSREPIYRQAHHTLDAADLNEDSLNFLIN